MSESTSQDWTRALALVKQARAEMAAAAKLLDSLDDVTKAAPNEIEAKIAKAEQARFEGARNELQLRLSNLQKTTEPPPAQIKSKIDDVESAINNADGFAEVSEWPKAQEALYRAQAAADEADEVAKLRKAFNDRAKALVGKAGKDDDLKAKVSHIVDAGKPLADKFDFTAANRVLDNADATFEGEDVKKLLVGRTDESKLRAAIQKMMSKTGGSAAAPEVKDGPKLLDDIVTNLPDSTKPDLIVKLAKERFGLDLDASKDEKELKQTRTLKSLYKTLAMTPDHTKDNPSLTKVSRIKPRETGGKYQSEKNETTMNGRPGKSTQEFGAGLTDELGPPNPTYADYRPVNDNPIDYFEFANVHETGHSVDDRLGFMKSHMGDAKFGGWATYGGNLGPIADAVAGKYGAVFAAELKDFVLDLMTGTEPDNLKAKEPTDQPALDDACNKIRSEWYKNACVDGKCWWRQAKCTAITIGDTIYHEAYKGTWVSYPAAERAKGITGYQFRSPAEWFAELFAAYHHGKLKKGHPAVDWLKAL